MAAPTYVGKGAFNSTTTSTLSVAWPAHAVGDLAFLVVITSSNNQNFVLPVASIVSGWTEVTDARYIASHGALQIYYRFATSTAMANASITNATGGIKQISGRIYTFRGVSTVTPYEGMAIIKGVGDSSGTPQTAFPKSGTATGPDRLAVLFAPLERNRNGTIPTGWVEQDDTVKVFNTGAFCSSDHLIGIRTALVANGQTSPAGIVSRPATINGAPWANSVFLLRPKGDKTNLTISLTADVGMAPTMHSLVPFSPYCSISLTADAGMTMLSTAYGQNLHVTLEADGRIRGDVSVNTNERVYVKSKFIPGRELSYDDFISLINYVYPDFTDSVDFLKDKSGVVQVETDSSGLPSLSVIETGSFADALIRGATSKATLSEMVAQFSQKNLLKKEGATVYFGTGLSANATTFDEVNNPIKISLEKQVAFTSVSATNVLIANTGYTEFSYCTAMSTQCLLRDTNTSVATSPTMDVSGDAFDIYYTGITATQAGNILLQVGVNQTYVTTGYTYIGASVQETTTFGLRLADKHDDRDYKKSGVINAYNMGSNNWYIFNHGISNGYINTGMARITTNATVSSCRLFATAGSLNNGSVRAISYRLGK